MCTQCAHSVCMHSPCKTATCPSYCFPQLQSVFCNTIFSWMLLAAVLPALVTMIYYVTCAVPMSPVHVKQYIPQPLLVSCDLQCVLIKTTAHHQEAYCKLVRPWTNLTDVSTNAAVMNLWSIVARTQVWAGTQSSRLHARSQQHIDASSCHRLYPMDWQWINFDGVKTASPLHNTYY